MKRKTIFKLLKYLAYLTILLICIISFIAYNLHTWKKRGCGYKITHKFVYYTPITYDHHWIDYFKITNFSTYTIKKIVWGANIETFEEIGRYGSNFYAKDKNYVFFGNEKLKNADPKSFEILTDGFSKDKNHVYFLNFLMPERDANTFEILNNYYSKDKNHVYYEYTFSDQVKHIIKEADPETFIILEKNDNGRFRYAKDKNFFYKEDIILCKIENNCLN